jgi:DNA-binding response OmpR family regulator/anti-sigma regulatory factor (Ser/Thr protein kinase)
MMKKVLVIDDAEFILESTSTLLKFEGYEVFTAADGVTGVETALRQQPDLILCDISMPGMDGYGVLEKIRSNAETATTPFIFLTAFTEKSNMRAGMEKGADDFIVKPYTRDELIAAIDAQWKKHSYYERQVQEKVEEVGRNVTYALPHEFRTVLNQVVGSAKYLKNNPDDVAADEIRELSDDIISSSQRLLKITENFLIYVSIESFASNPEKRKQLRSYRTDEPGAMITDIASLVAQRYERTEDLITKGEIESIAVEISTESFHKIIDELLDNAFKFSDEGTPIILKLWLENDFLFIELIDEGRGMSKEQIASVGAYIQFERSIYEQQGVGLGLVIAKRLVELHDGIFEIESEEGKGTRVCFSLPFSESE